MKRKVILDPGHGGRDPGCVYDGVKEKDINLSICRKMFRRRDENFSFRMTRNKDVNVPLSVRVAIANKLDAFAFISIHQNAFEDKRANGTEVYFYSPTSRKLAEAVCRRIAKLNMFASRGVKFGNFLVLRSLRRSILGILVECGFLSNDGDRKYLADFDRHMEIASAILWGLEDIL